MLKEGVVRRFGQFMKVASWNGNLPYTWDDKLQRLEHESNFWVLSFWKVRLMIIFMYCSYLTSRILLQLFLWKKESKKVSHLTIHFMWCTIYILCCLLHMSTILKRTETLNFVNQFLQFNSRQLQKLYGTSLIPRPERLRHEKNARNLETLLKIFGLISINHTIIAVVAFLVFAQKPYFISSVFLKHVWNHPVIILFFAIFEFSCYTHNWINCLFHIFVLVFHLMSMRHWLFELRKKLTNCRGVGVFGKARRANLLLEYKRLLTLNHRFEEYSRIIWTGHKLIIIPLTIAGSYGASRLYKKVSMAIFLIYPIIFIVCFIFQSIFYRLSMELYRDARIIHKNFMQRHVHKGLESGENFLFSAFRPKFPKFVSSYKMYRQWSPLTFIQKLFFYCIKIDFYLHSNIEIFKRSQQDMNIT